MSEPTYNSTNTVTSGAFKHDIEIAQLRKENERLNGVDETASQLRAEVDRLKAERPPSTESWLDALAEIERLTFTCQCHENSMGLFQKEVERLKMCLLKANEQTEKFEREWYLRGDEVEALKQGNEGLRYLVECLQRSLVEREGKLAMARERLEEAKLARMEDVAAICIEAIAAIDAQPEPACTCSEINARHCPVHNKVGE
jgi:chromosome segregation ATPase